MRLRQFLVVAGNSVVVGNSSQKWEHLLISYEQCLQKNLTLLWSDSQCVCFIRPNTLLLCIFLFCIFLLYCTDPQVEVQIRILLKDKYIGNCVKNANPGNPILISWTMLIGFHYFTEATQYPRYTSHKIQTLCYCVSLSCIVWIYNLTVTIISQKYQGRFFSSRN